MQMLYNSDSFVVVRFDVPSSVAPDVPSTPTAAAAAAMAAGNAPTRGGFEIVDKFARQEIYLQGAVADSFRRDIEALVDSGTSEEAMDDFLSGFMVLGRQTLSLH